MGKVINHATFASLRRGGLLKPIICCGGFGDTERGAKSINIELAKELEALSPKQRTMRLEASLNRVLDALPENPVIKDFDVMFNPAYKVDVLNMLIAACRRKPFSVIWPGRYENGKLFYAEEGYADYKVFDISKYDVTCVI